MQIEWVNSFSCDSQNLERVEARVLRFWANSVTGIASSLMVRLNIESKERAGSHQNLRSRRRTHSISEALRHLNAGLANGTGSIIGSYAYLNQVIRYCRFARRKASSSVLSRAGSVGATGSGARRPRRAAADRTDRPTDSAPSHAMANRRLRPPLATMGHVRGVYRRQRVL